MKSEARSRRFTIHLLSAGLTAFLSCTSPSVSQELDVPYIATPQVVVDRMLDLAAVGPGDYLIDLGSGDGRIVISAALRGAKGHGVDIDPERVREAEENAKASQVRDRVLFLEKDIFETEFRSASVVTMYLLSELNLRLRPKILDECRPGTRIVSHRFDMGEWRADAVERVDARDGLGPRTIHYWVVPAQVGGTWTWKQDGQTYRMKIRQRFQRIEVELESDVRKFNILDAGLKGAQFSLTVESGLARFIFFGFVEGNSIEGIVQIRDRATQRVEPWRANK